MVGSFDCCPKTFSGFTIRPNAAIAPSAISPDNLFPPICQSVRLFIWLSPCANILPSCPYSLLPRLLIPFPSVGQKRDSGRTGAGHLITHYGGCQIKYRQISMNQLTNALIGLPVRRQP